MLMYNRCFVFVTTTMQLIVLTARTTETGEHLGQIVNAESSYPALSIITGYLESEILDNYGQL